MRLKFIFPDGTTKISNNFYVDEGDQEVILDDFINQFCGNNIDQIPKWNADIDGDEDFITLKWLEYPQNINEVIDDIGDWFGQKIDDFESWV